MDRAMPARNSDRTYKNAITILNGRRRPERPGTGSRGSLLDASSIHNATSEATLKGAPSIYGMSEWLSDIGYSVSLPELLRTGTKGKGSTCAFVEVLLRTFGERAGFPRKTGLYTSPHLIYPEERIRINFEPIARDLFAKYFFEVWEALSKDGESRAMPRYLQLLALVAFHTFIQEGVDAAIIETHHGGEYDSTNVIEHPVATVITPLGMDHVQQLGPTIDNIAWHKAGIFKAGASAFSSVQVDSAAEVLRNRASEKKTSIIFVKNDLSLPHDTPQLKPDVQRMNCSLALAVVHHFIEKAAPDGNTPLLASDIRQAIARFSWPGRFQIVNEGKFQWYLDGAHNIMSIVKAAEWFIEHTEAQSIPHELILIFSQISKQRDATVVLEHLASALSGTAIHHVMFTSYDPRQDFDSTDATASKQEDALQETFVKVWKQFHPESRVLCNLDAQAALEYARDIGNRAGAMHTLVTGSQHLVGAVLHSFDHSGLAQG